MKKFLEIGACEAHTWATDRLSDGWYGVFVEAHPAAFVKLVESYKDFPNAQFIAAAVSTKSGLEEFSCFADDFTKHSGASCLERSVKYKHRPTIANRGNSTFWVYTVPFNTLIDHVRPNICRIDVEGEEIPILRSFDANFNHAPQEIHVEFHDDVKSIQAVEAHLKVFGYQTDKLHFADTGDTIFRRTW